MPFIDDRTFDYGEIFTDLVDVATAGVATSAGLLGHWTSLATGCGERAAAALALVVARPERPEDSAGLGCAAAALLDAYAAYVRVVATMPRNCAIQFACELDRARERRRSSTGP